MADGLTSPVQAGVKFETRDMGGAGHRPAHRAPETDALLAEISGRFSTLATDAKLEAIRLLLVDPDLPTGAATDAKLEQIRLLLVDPDLPTGAASDTKLEAVRALLETSYGAPSAAAVPDITAGGATFSFFSLLKGAVTNLLGIRTAVTAAGTILTGQGSATTSTGQLVAARTGRQSVTVMNEGTTDVRLGPAGVTTGSGILLPGVKGASISLPTAAAVHAITASGTAALSYVETF